jgi:hypothetical protein
MSMSQSPHKLDHLITQILALEEKSKQEKSQIAFMARALVMATLPHSKPDNNYFERKNGHHTLSMIANPKFGLPYGSMPRLLLAWITTRAVESKSSEIHLGRTLSAFLKKLNLRLGGGKRGNATRVREQMMRLLSCKISYTYENKRKGICESNQFNISRSFKLLWNPENSNQKAFLPTSTIILSADFYEELIASSVPINFDTLNLLRKSPLQMDIYIWLTYRFFSLKNETFISWKVLMHQFGSDYANGKEDSTRAKRNFKMKFLQALRKISMVYPLANVGQTNAGLVLYPSETHVKKVQKKGKLAVDNSSYPR